MIPSENQEQGIYQVRFDWGTPGVQAIAVDADVLVLVDVLGHREGFDPQETAATVVAGGFQNRTAVARWVLARQAEKGERVAVAVVAVGDKRSDGTLRFTVEDLLAAGSIIDALAIEGIDYCSPEAAAACAAFTGLKSAVGHLLTASVSGINAAPSGSRVRLEMLANIDSSHEVSLLQE